MEFKKWIYGAAALSLLAACSDRDIAPGNGENGSNGEISTASGYLALEIKLPQETSSTRAGENEQGTNDKFEDGEAYEYTVENAMIVLFKGKKTDGEKKAKFYRAQNLTKPFFTNQPSDDQITSSYLAAIPVTVERNADENFWALVILNNNEATTGVIGGSEDDNNNTTEGFKIAGTEFTKDNTFADVLKTKTTNSFLGVGEKSRFFMTNAPLSNIAGGYYAGTTSPLPQSEDDHISYLADLGGADKVYETPDDAKKNISACVYVERAVAKVSYKDGKLADNAIQLKFVKEDGSEYGVNDIEVSAVVEYALTNTNKTSYVIRNLDFSTKEDDKTDADGHFSWALSTRAFNGLNYSRMVGSEPMVGLGAPFHTSPQAFFRTYWCKDPNYYREIEATEKNTVAAGDFKGIDQYLYCKENTFTVKNQDHDNSTVAVFKVNYTLFDKTKNSAINHLFIKDGDNSKIYISKESAAAAEISRIINDVNIREAMKNALKENASSEEYNVREHLDIDIARLTSDGVLTQSLGIKSIKLKVPEGGDDWFDSSSAGKFLAEIGQPDDEKSYQYQLLTNVNALSDITEFTDAITYYSIPVMHFGDFYTPWNTAIDAGEEDSIEGVETKDVYNGGYSWNSPTEDHASKYLGRYGMVRNNWYELNITAIKALGSPTIPDNYDHLSDDYNEVKKYFAIEIHTLSWAKRSQNVEF